MAMKYTLINKRTGKTILKFRTREDARVAKADRGYKHAILNLETNTIIR